MTTRDILQSMRAAWPALVVGLLVTVLASYYVSRPDGTYWSRVSVYFLAPSDIENDNANTIAFTSDSVIATAGLVAHLVGTRGTGASTSSDTSLVAEGIRHGHRVRLPNTGGQWAANFAQPVLDVEVVGADPSEVGLEATRLIEDVTRTLDTLQADDGVPAHLRITTTRAPAEVQVHHATGDRKRALAVAVLLGVALSVLISVAWDRRRHRRRPLLSGGSTPLPPAAGPLKDLTC